MTDKTPFRKLYAVATAMLIIGAATCFALLVQVAFWATDREPPFVLISYDAPPTRAGDIATITAKVHREMSRKCSATYSRMLIDARANTHDLTEGVRMVNADTITELNRRSPDAITVKVKIPEAAAPGPGVVMTALEYTCNPLHQAYPIPVTLMENIIILEKR